MSRPFVGQHVDIVLPQREPLDARVEEMRGDLLLLELLGDASVAEILGDDVTLHFTNRRGLCSLEGLVSEGSAKRFWFAPRGAIRLVQRRENVRVSATVRVTFAPNGHERVEGHTLDLSGGGFVLASACGLESGATTHFTIHLAQDSAGAIEVFGTAVRPIRSGGMAVRIDVISPGDREHLIHWIFRRERLTRAFARGA